MRHVAWGLLCGLLGVAALQADSWVPPKTLTSLAADGRTFVVITPDRGTKAVFQLVERRPRGTRHPAEVPEAPGPGDRVLARGKCSMPMGVHCLARKKGFVLFETYGSVGTGVVAVRYDGEGRVVWSRRLRELFTPQEIGGLRATSSSVWWFETHGLDEARGDLLVVYESPRATGPGDPDGDLPTEERRLPGVLRVALRDGKARKGRPEDLLRLLDAPRGRREVRLAALDAVSRARPAGTASALRRLLSNAEEDRVIRVMAAVHLHRAGDARGRDVVVDAARRGVPSDVRKHALEHLPEILDLHAIVYLRGALREADRETAPAIWRAFSTYGARAVDALAKMVNEPGTSERYRSTAIQLLARLGAEASPALPALELAAKDRSDAVAENAAFALEVIAKARRGR